MQIMKYLFILLIGCAMLIPAFGQEPETVPEEHKTGEVQEVPALQETPELPAASDLPEAPELPAAPEMPEAPELQEEPSEAPPVGDTIRIMKRAEVIETPDKTRITLGENEVLIVEENGDTVRVTLGSRGISIVEGDEGTEIKVIEMDDDEEGEDNRTDDDNKERKKKKFKPHYAGLEIGLNNYLTPDFSMNLPPEQRFMDLNTGRSWNFNLNFLEYGLGLGTDKVGIVTGLGFEWTNYVFDNQNSITKDENGDIVEYVPDNAGNIIKSKMNMTYLTAPLLLEFQIPAGKKRIHLSGGLIGGVKIASNTKIKYEIGGQKSKEKSKGDYNLAPLRYGATVRVGYRALNLYANYYLMSLFGENGGPELYPFSIGLCLIPF